MSKLIRSTTLVRRPHVRRTKRPIYVIASGGDVFVAKWVGKTLTWVEATEADFGVKPSSASNDALFNKSSKT